jgi:hypothetical protein
VPRAGSITEPISGWWGLLASLRRLRFTAPQLADLLEMPVSTISGILKRIGLGKLGRLGLEPAQRYQRERPGELIHIDVKRLGRIHGGAGKRYGYRRGVPKRTDLAGVRRGITGWDAGTSPLMTPLAWPTSKCSQTKKQPRPSPSLDEQQPSTSSTGSRSSA